MEEEIREGVGWKNTGYDHSAPCQHSLGIPASFPRAGTQDRLQERVLQKEQTASQSCSQGLFPSQATGLVGGTSEILTAHTKTLGLHP